MSKEEIIPPGVTQRCPKCKKLSLSFDPETNRIVCGACGYEERLRV